MQIIAVLCENENYMRNILSPFLSVLAALKLVMEDGAITFTPFHDACGDRSREEVRIEERWSGFAMAE